MAVYLCWTDVVVVVFWAVDRLGGVHVSVHFRADSERVQVRKAEQLELVSDGLGRRSRWEVLDEPEESFLGSYQRL